MQCSLHAVLRRWGFLPCVEWMFKCSCTFQVWRQSLAWSRTQDTFHCYCWHKRWLLGISHIAPLVWLSIFKPRIKVQFSRLHLSVFVDFVSLTQKEKPSQVLCGCTWTSGGYIALRSLCLNFKFVWFWFGSSLWSLTKLWLFSQHIT